MCRLCTADDHWYFRCLVLSKAFGSFGYPAKIRRIGDSKKALEHFVLKNVQQADFIHSPSVKVKIIKNKVRVMIDGEMKQTAAIPQQQEALVGEISSKLQTLFGVTHDIQTEVVLKDAEETREHHTQPRVV